MNREEGTWAAAPAQTALHKREWSLVILTDYLGDPVRAAELYHDFAACSINRFTDDCQLTGREIDDVLLEVEVLRARWRALVMRD